MRSGVSALRPPVLITYDMQGNLSRTENYSGDPGCPFSNACSESSTIATW